jgi:predicted acetyltransferase
MNSPKLILPCESYLNSYLEACIEFKEHNITTYPFYNPDHFDEWKNTIFKAFYDDRNGINLKAGYVPATTFWLVDNNELIGTGSIRHSLTDKLEKFGGHIGYAIRYSKWNQGYGTKQLGLLINEAAKLDLKRVLVTCNENNIASARVIEKNGGVYQDTIENVIDGVPRYTKRYWIDIVKKLI